MKKKIRVTGDGRRRGRGRTLRAIGPLPKAPDAKAGFVYCVANRAMPGKVKIGFTTGAISDRLEQLYTTGVAEPFHIVGVWLSPDPRSDERLVHRALDRFRVHEAREFFALSERAAARRIDTLMGKNIGAVSGAARRHVATWQTVAAVSSLVAGVSIAACVWIAGNGLSL